MTTQNSKLLSLIVLSYQSENNLTSLCKLLLESMQAENIPFEIIIIDDGSKDNSFIIAKQLASKHSEVRAYQLSKNFTSPYTQFAGFSMTKGGCAVPIADDLQRPIESVIRMYREWEKGAKIVIGYRKSRNDGKISDLFSSIYYYIMNRFSNVTFPLGGADGFLADREIIDILVNKVSHKNTSPIIEVLQLGFDPVFLPFDRPKVSSKSRWTMKKKIKLASDTFFSSSVFPIKLVSIIGFLMFFIAGFLSILIIGAKLFSNNTLFGLPIPGWATLVLITMFFNGIMMLSIGILAEYIWRIFEEVKGRPPYIIKEQRKDDEDKA